MKTFSATFKKFRETSQQPIMVHHCDRPGNPWSVLFSNALSSPDSYLTLPNVYMAGVGRNFYHRVFPENMLSVAYTTFALHWLSTHSSSENQLQRFVEKDPDFHAELRSLSNQDLHTFLSHRAAELRPEGSLILHLLTSEPSHAAYYHSLAEMTSEGLISPTPLRMCPVFLYYSTPEDLTAAVGRVPSLRLTSLQVVNAYDPIYQKYLADHNAAEYAKLATMHFKAIADSGTSELFKTEKGDIAVLGNTLFAKIETWFREHPVPLVSQEIDAVVEKIRET